MEMIDLKRPKKKKNEGKEEMPTTVAEEDRYPWGLRITLETEELDKLGLKPNDFDVGAAITLQGEGKIEEISQRETTGQEKGRKSISIQIMKMAVSGGKKGSFQKFEEIQEAGPGGKT